MGVNGKTCTTMVFDLAEDGESIENYTHGATAGSNNGYWGSECASIF